jgi:hypothetical protein
MIGDLSDFLSYARERMLASDETLPCEPEDCAAVMGYLCALVPEYELDRQANVASSEARSVDRKQAILAGLRKARGAKASAPAAPSAATGASQEAAGSGEAA